MRRFKRAAWVIGSVALTLSLAACSGSGGGSGPTQAVQAQGACGEIPKYEAKDPKGLIAGLPEIAQKAMNGFIDGEVDNSAWENAKARTEPIKAAVVALQVTTPFGVAQFDEWERRFKELEAQGKTTGEFRILTPSDASTATVADQIRLYQQLVDQGYNLIFVTAIDGPAFAKTVDEAGERGVITVGSGPAIPSKYAVNVVPNAYINSAGLMAKGAKMMGGEGNLLAVHGAQGLSQTAAFKVGVDAVLATCPNIKLLGEVYGGFDPATAKQQITLYLASHPQPLDGVFSAGLMGKGVYSTFIDRGGELPVIMDGGASGSSLEYFAQVLEKDPSYQGAGSVLSGRDYTAAFWDAGIATFQGRGPKVNMLGFIPPLVDKDNLNEFRVKGATIEKDSDVQPEGHPGMPKELLDAYFQRPAPAEG